MQRSYSAMVGALPGGVQSALIRIQKRGAILGIVLLGGAGRQEQKDTESELVHNRLP